jgi:hypothetical protein
MHNFIVKCARLLSLHLFYGCFLVRIAGSGHSMVLLGCNLSLLASNNILIQNFNNRFE